MKKKRIRNAILTRFKGYKVAALSLDYTTFKGGTK